LNGTQPICWDAEKLTWAYAVPISKNHVKTHRYKCLAMTWLIILLNDNYLKPKLGTISTALISEELILFTQIAWQMLPLNAFKFIQL